LGYQFAAEVGALGCDAEADRELRCRVVPSNGWRVACELLAVGAEHVGHFVREFALAADWTKSVVKRSRRRCGCQRSFAA
jgi:hypothetical protein